MGQATLIRRRAGRGGKPNPRRLLRRFLRNRVADPTGFTEKGMEDWLDQHGKVWRDYDEELAHRWYWQERYEDANPTLAVKHFEIRQFLRITRSRAGHKLFDAWPMLQGYQDELQQEEPWLPIEERLLLHVESLFNHPEDSALLRESFQNSPFRIADVDFIDREEKSSDFRDMLAAFLPFWIRSPRTCRGRIDRARILAHVFAKFPEEMPRFADAFQDCSWSDLKAFVWLIVVGYRGSLQRTADAFGWRIPNKFQFALETIDPFPLPGIDIPTVSLLKQATILAEVTRLGGSALDACRLLQHPAYAIDPSDLAIDDGLIAFWSETVQWVAAHRDRMGELACWQILDWAMHEYTERCRQADPKRLFRWKGRTVAAAAQMAARYRAKLAAKESENKTWPARNLSWFCETETAIPSSEGEGEALQQIVTKWQFVELTSGKSLNEEGEALRHCVGTYWDMCMGAASAIVSLRKNGQRWLTIDVDPSTMEVDSALGYCNREATTQERKIIERWVQEWVISHGIRHEVAQDASVS